LSPPRAGFFPLSTLRVFFGCLVLISEKLVRYSCAVIRLAGNYRGETRKQMAAALYLSIREIEITVSVRDVSSADNKQAEFTILH